MSVSDFIRRAVKSEKDCLDSSAHLSPSLLDHLMVMNRMSPVTTSFTTAMLSVHEVVNPSSRCVKVCALYPTIAAVVQ